MSKHFKPTAITIQIERLTTGTVISINAQAFTGFAVVYAIEFDGEGYDVTFCTDDRMGWDAVDTIHIPTAGSVEFGGVGEPALRADEDISLEELEAKADAIDATCLRLQGKSNELQGHVCRPVDEQALVVAVAAAVGVPALIAAE